MKLQIRDKFLLLHYWDYVIVTQYVKVQRDPESFLLTMCATKGKQANITNQNLWRWNHEHRKYHQRKSLKVKPWAQKVPSIKKQIHRTPGRNQKNYWISETWTGCNMRVKTLRNLEGKFKSEKQDSWKLLLKQTRGKMKIWKGTWRTSEERNA